MQAEGGLQPLNFHSLKWENHRALVVPADASGVPVPVPPVTSGGLGPVTFSTQIPVSDIAAFVVGEGNRGNCKFTSSRVGKL